MKKMFVAMGLVVLLSGCGRLTGRGEKVGTIIKVSQEGFFFKTWEVEIIRGGMNGGSGGFSTKPLHVTVMNEDLLPEVRRAFDEQKEVVVTYEEHLFVFTLTSECTDGCKYLTSIRE